MFYSWTNRRPVWMRRQLPASCSYYTSMSGYYIICIHWYGSHNYTRKASLHELLKKWSSEEKFNIIPFTFTFSFSLSRKGNTIIFSIHQPRYSIFKLFDYVCLLGDGHMMYNGPANEALEYFEEIGKPLEFVTCLPNTSYSKWPFFSCKV